MSYAVITGGSRGIGRAIAESLASIGYNLVLVAKDSVRLSTTAHDIEQQHHVKVIHVACDLANDNAGTVIANAIQDRGILPDVLVFNAGTYLEGDLDSPHLCDEPFSLFEETLRVNCFSILRCVQALIGDLQKGNRKRIVIIGSTAAHEAYHFGPSYGVSKWATRGLAINLREELKSSGIGVTLVTPGGTLTDLWAGEELPPKRLLEPADIGKVVKLCVELSEQAVVEEIVIRPMLGDMHT
jgi:short-subunit dehydrogenase